MLGIDLYLVVVNLANFLKGFLPCLSTQNHLILKTLIFLISLLHKIKVIIFF